VQLVPDAGASAHVLAVSFLGALCRIQVELPDRSVIVAQVSAAEASQFGPGTPVRVGVLSVPVFATPG
jgi:putative spermidine/putrescine transport system ATP-binding protein